MSEAESVIPDKEVELDDGNGHFSYGYPNRPIDFPHYEAANSNVEGEASFHEAQLAFILSEAKVTVGQAGIRGGKTHGGAFKMIVHACNNPTQMDEFHLVCSPTFPMSKVPVEKMFTLLYDKKLFPVNPLIRYSRSERVFILQSCIPGRVSRVKVVSLHDPDRIRGIKALSAWLDEGAYITKYAWEVVQGRLMDSNGPCWITTTPSGYNWVYDLYAKALEEKKAGVPIEKRKIRFVHWGSAANPFLSKEGLEELAANYDSRTADQELRALFVRTAGLIYRYSASRNLKPWRLDRSKPVYIGQDFNVSKMASVFCQMPTKTTLHAFHDRLAPDSDTAALVLYVGKWCEQNNFPREKVIFFPDASGAARSTSGKSDIRIIKEAGFKVEFSKKNPYVKDRVNCVNGLLAPLKGPTRFFVDPSCAHVLQTLGKQIWNKDDPPAPDKEHGFDHIGDALGYVAWGKLPLAVTASLGNKKAA